MYGPFFREAPWLVGPEGDAGRLERFEDRLGEGKSKGMPKGTGKSIRFDATVAPICDHAVPRRSKLNAAAQDVKLAVPGVFDV